MWFQILMLACMIPVMPVIYMMLANETKPKKNIIMGVTLPLEARSDKAVERICREFRKGLLKSALLLLVVPIATFFIPWFSIVITIWMLWITLIIIVPHWQYVRANCRLRQLKRENGWFSDLSGVEIVDTQAVTVTLRRLSWKWFVPAVVLGALPFLVTLFTQYQSEEYGWMLFSYGVNAALVLMMAAIHRIIYRQRTETIDADTDLSVALTRVRRYNWSKCWLWMTWLTAGFSLLFWVFLNNGYGILIVSLVYTVALLGITLRTEMITRAAQERLTANSGRIGYRDEDENWIFGLVYYNTNDSHLIVNNRVGMGTSVNLARPAGKALMGFSLIVLLAMPFLGIWCMVEEFTPIRLSVVGDTIVVDHVGTVYELPATQVERALWIEELPPHQKIVGTNMESLLKGKFRLTGEKDAELYLNPQKGPFLRLELKEGETVILGSTEQSETEQVYQMLEKQTED